MSVAILDVYAYFRAKYGPLFDSAVEYIDHVAQFEEPSQFTNRADQHDGQQQDVNDTGSDTETDSQALSPLPSSSPVRRPEQDSALIEFGQMTSEVRASTHTMLPEEMAWTYEQQIRSPLRRQ